MVRLISLLFICLSLVTTASAQFRSSALGGVRIQGQVWINRQPAPEGVLVYLDRSRGRDSSFTNGSGELGNTMTDSRGKFSFEGVDAGQERPEGKVYVVTVHYPGYRTATQILDLTASPVGFANIEMRPDTSKNSPDTPAPGGGSMISAKQPSSVKARDQLARAEELLIQKHDPRQSIGEFKKLLKMEPEYGPGYVLLGTAHMQLQEWADAQSAFEKATKFDPTNASAYLGIGAAMNQQQEFSSAQKPLQHSLELNPNSAEADYELGRSFWGLKKWEEAEPFARKAVQVNPNFPPAHVLIGNICLRHRDAHAALTEYQEYLRLDPQGEHAQAVKEMIDKIEKALSQR